MLLTFLIIMFNFFSRSEVSFAEIQHSIQIGEEEVEEFLIDVIKTKLVRAKIAQGDNMVHVSSTMHRTFGPGDWQQLHQLLTQVQEALVLRCSFKPFSLFSGKATSTR